MPDDVTSLLRYKSVECFAAYPLFVHKSSRLSALLSVVLWTRDENERDSQVLMFV